MSDKKRTPETKPKAGPEKKTASESADATSATPAEGKSDANEAPGRRPTGHSTGEGQKIVTDRYRNGWDSIFGKKR